jgi:hypothetical protein
MVSASLLRARAARLVMRARPSIVGAIAPID